MQSLNRLKDIQSELSVVNSLKVIRYLTTTDYIKVYIKKAINDPQYIDLVT